MELIDIDQYIWTKPWCEVQLERTSVDAVTFVPTQVDQPLHAVLPFCVCFAQIRII